MKEFLFAQSWYYFIIAAVFCYFIGCFNFAVIISHHRNKDILREGSGNPGTMNMTRTFGLKVGAFNFFLDVIKGGVPAMLGYLLFKDYVFAGTSVCVADFARYFFGLFVIVGHVFPVTMKFKGGKGIASTMGIFLFALPCENWWYVFICIAIYICTLSYIIFFEWGSMGSLFGVSALTVFQAVVWFMRYQGNLTNGWVIVCFALLLAINLLTWLAHHKNLFKLVAGEEHRTVVRKRKTKKV